MAFLSPYLAALYSAHHSLILMQWSERAACFKFPGLLVGEPPDTCGGHNVVDTRANVPSHIFSIVLYAAALKHIPVCYDKTFLQGAFCACVPELNVFYSWVCFIQSLFVGWVQKQRNVIRVFEVKGRCSPVCKLQRWDREENSSTFWTNG